MIGSPVPEQCYEARSKGYAAEQVAKAYSNCLVQMKIMDEDFKVVNTTAYHNALQRVVQLNVADGGYSAASIATAVVMRIAEERKWSLLPLLDRTNRAGSQVLYQCKWRLTMRRHQDC